MWALKKYAMLINILRTVCVAVCFMPFAISERWPPGVLQTSRAPATQDVRHRNPRISTELA